MFADANMQHVFQNGVLPDVMTPPGLYIRFFVWGEKWIPKKTFEPRGGEKNSFRPSRGSGGMLPRKILKI